MSKMPAQKPHRSVQEVETPPELIEAVERRFGIIDFDLAASPHNAKARRFFTKEDDALTQNWQLGPSVRVAWLNPEFGDARRYAEKCREVRELRRWTLMLVPQGTPDWADEFVWGQCLVLKLKGRVQFVGHAQGFPKDLMLCCYGFGVVGEEVWDWRGVGDSDLQGVPALLDGVPKRLRPHLERVSRALYTGQKSRAKAAAQASYLALLRELAEAHS